jgi:hypothetical protein
MIQVYQDIVQPVVRFPWESMREHEPSRAFVQGSTQYFELATSVLSGVPSTFSTWFNVNDLTNDHILMALANSSGATVFFILRAAGGIAGDPLRFTARNAGTARHADTTVAFKMNTWQHALARVRSATDRDCRIDNGSEGTSTDAITPAGIDTMSIGRVGDSSPTGNIDGRLSWPCFWNVYLTDAEGGELASGRPPWEVRPESIVACPDFRTLWDPFLKLQFPSFNGPTIANPYRDWTLPGDTAQFIDTPVAAAAGIPILRRRMEAA